MKRFTHPWVCRKPVTSSSSSHEAQLSHISLLKLWKEERTGDKKLSKCCYLSFNSFKNYFRILMCLLLSSPLLSFFLSPIFRFSLLSVLSALRLFPSDSGAGALEQNHPLIAVQKTIHLISCPRPRESAQSSVSKLSRSYHRVAAAIFSLPAVSCCEFLSLFRLASATPLWSYEKY